jgi:transcription elongation factor GreA
VSIRDQLPPILRGEAAAELVPETRVQLETLAHQAQASGEIVFVRDECAGRLRQPGASLGVEYLLGCACALHGERERALQTFLALGDRLAQRREWEALAAIAEWALALEETAAAARLLVRAHEGLRVDPERLEALQRAWRISPEDLELGLLLAVRLGDAGRGDQRRALLAELLPRFAAEGRHAGLEEAALEFVENQDLSGLLRVVGVLPDVAAHGAIQEAKQLLDVAFPLLAKAGRAGEVEGALREVSRQAAAKDPGAAETFRAPLLETIRQGHARSLPDPEAVLVISGLLDPLKPLMPALAQFDLVAALPPGRAVLHGSFGAGRIRSNDGENVVIDFTRSTGHRMPQAAARRTLTPLAENDLRLLKFTDPQSLERLTRERPGEILVRALESMGGEADAQKLKLFLVGHGIIAANEWTSSFRKLKAAAEADPRIDHARAYEQIYRLAPADLETAIETPLPALGPRKPVRSNLATIRKFLSQHPGAEAALAQRFGRYVERAMLDESGETVDRARAGLYLVRWLPERAESWPEVLKQLWEQGLVVSDLSGEEEQLALLEASHAAGVEADAILTGLDSRFNTVRDRAAVMREALDPSGRQSLRRTMLDHAPRYPQAALRLIAEELENGPSEPAADDDWRLLWAALALIEERPKPSTAEVVLGWIIAGGPFERRLAGRACSEEHRLRLTVLLRQWRSSDRYLFPALELAERIGLAEVVAAVHAAREASTRKLFDQVGRQADVDLPVMTRATWERLNGELERMERELRTEIPKTIQRARELGDLRENAEYHSAKLKQANLSKQVAALQLRLRQARFVDDVPHQEGVAGPGSEVVIERDHQRTTYWILGEDEHHHGKHVISFQAPVGRALTGKAIGDEVMIEGRAHRIVSVERKLPQAAAQDAGA